MASQLLHINLPIVRCGEQAFPSGQSQDQVITPQFATVWLQHGSSEHRDGQGHRFHLAAGDAFHRFPNVMHSVHFAPGSRTIYLAVPGEALPFLRSCAVGFLDSPVFRPGPHADLARQVAAIAREIPHRPVRSLALMATRVLSLVCELHLRAGRHSGSHLASQLERAMAHLSDPRSAPLRQTALAASLGLSYRTYRRAFVLHAGCTPETYRIRCRISAAQELLTTTSQQIRDIAEHLGYRDAADFARQFRRFCGRSPRSFRLHARLI